MGGSSEKMDIQMAPLMSELQRDFLEKMLQGVIQSVSGFPLGAGFPGYGPDMYSPMPFKYGEGSGKTRIGDDKTRIGDDKTRIGDSGGIGTTSMMTPGIPAPGGFTPVGGGATPGGLTPIPPRGFTPVGGGTPAMGGQTSPTPLSWFSMLNQQDPMAMIPEMLTSPFMDPWRYGLTGNYPRRM